MSTKRGCELDPAPRDPEQVPDWRWVVPDGYEPPRWSDDEWCAAEIRTCLEEIEKSGHVLDWDPSKEPRWRLAWDDGTLLSEDEEREWFARFEFKPPDDPPPVIGIEPDPEPPWHGTAGGYTNHGCRCALCRAAHREAKSYADRRKAFEREGLALIESETNTVEGDVDPRGNPTVRDFVRCKPTETYSCVRGGYWTHDRLSNGQASARIRHGYGACGTVCPHCAPWWASERLKILIGMLFSTEDGPHAVWMLRHEWDERGAEIREAYTAEPEEDGKRGERFYSVWYVGDFEHVVVLTPGPTDGSRPVSGREVAEIILSSPGDTGGKHRYFGAPLRRPRKPSEWKSFHFPGYAARNVSSTVEFALGKTFREDDESDTWRIHVASKSMLGVTDEDVMKHRHTVETLRDERRHWDELADELFPAFKCAGSDSGRS